LGHGKEARDLRRAWGDYAAHRTKENGGVIPPEIFGIHLRFNTENKQVTGDLSEAFQLLEKA
jgi:hypothetical protein